MTCAQFSLSKKVNILKFLFYLISTNNLSYLSSLTLPWKKTPPSSWKYRRTVYGKSYQISISLNRLAQTGFLIGFYENRLTLIAFPVCRILNASFRGQRLPRSWKFTHVIPLPKKKPVETLKKDLRSPHSRHVSPNQLKGSS